jgi:transposase-like protein
MHEQAPVVEVRRRRSRAEAEQLVAEYEASGLSQVEFCRKQGLSLATLARYRKRQAQGSPAAGNRWVEVKECAGRRALGNPASSGSGGGIAEWPSNRGRARV